MIDSPQRIDKLKQLTQREREVFEIRSKGKTIAEIAEVLFISINTVKFHLSNIYSKLQVDNLSRVARNLEMARYYETLQLIPEEEIANTESTLELEPSMLEPTDLVIVLEDEIELFTEKSKALQIWEPIPPPPDTESVSQKQRQATRNTLIAFVLVSIISAFAGAGVMSLINQLSDVSQDFQHSSSSDAISQKINTPAPITPTVVATASITGSTDNLTDTNLEKICGENRKLEDAPGPQFLRHQGVSIFTPENTSGTILHNRIRALAADDQGMWIGYFNAEEENGGISYLTLQDGKRIWANCNEAGFPKGKRINAIAVDHTNKVWATTDGDGVLMFDGTLWHSYTITNSTIPDNRTYGLTIDQDNNVWVTTWEGVTKFNGSSWEKKYTAADSLISSHVHAIQFDDSDNIWIGYISDGISKFDSTNDKWIHYNANEHEISGNKIQSIFVNPAHNNLPETVWFATRDGGITVFKEGEWIIHNTETGFPATNVQHITNDVYHRIWAATDKGVFYFDDEKWKQYNNISSLSIAFMSDCPDQSKPCNDHVWAGTDDMGLTHHRLPYQESPVNFERACFEPLNKEPNCQLLSSITNTSVITITYPKSISPDERFQFSLTVIPKSPYNLRAQADFLSNTDEDDFSLFGAHSLIQVKEVVDPGQHYTFVDYDKPFQAPLLDKDEKERTFVSTWRIWSHTRYVGPSIRLVFTVRED